MTEAQRTKLQKLSNKITAVKDQLHEVVMELIEDRDTLFNASKREAIPFAVVMNEIDDVLSARDSTAGAETEIENAIGAELNHK